MKKMKNDYIIVKSENIEDREDIKDIEDNI